MKRKMSKFLLVLVIACICGCMFALAACNNGNDNDDTPDYSENSTTMMAQVWEKLGNSISAGEKFGIDIAANLVVDDKEADKSTYKLVVKGNVDATAQAAENATNLNISIVKEEGTSRETLFGFAYEVIDGEPYFYIDLLNGGYEKINGYSLISLVQMADGLVKNLGGSLGIDLNGMSLTSLVGGILFEKTGTVKDNVYTFRFNLVNMVERLAPVLGKLGAAIDGVIGDVFSNLTYENEKGETVNVTDIKTLIEYISATMSVTGDVVFNFDANDKFVSAAANFDYIGAEDAKQNYAVNVSKIDIGAVETPIDTFNGFVMSGKDKDGADTSVRGEIVAKNLLNFSIKGKVNGLSDKNEVKTTYDININSDVNPFVLMSIIADSSKENVLSSIKDLGYFALTIDEKDLKTNKVKRNIMTIYSNFADGYAIINAGLNGLIVADASFGGVYQFDELYDMIAALVKPAGTVAEEIEGEEGGIDIMSVIMQIVGALSINGDIRNNGVTLDMNAVSAMLKELLNVDGMTMIALNTFLGLGTAPKNNIKITETTFGTCDRSLVDVTKIRNDHRAKFAEGTRNYVKEITSLEGISSINLGTVGNLEDALIKDVAIMDEFFYKATGKDFADNKVNTSVYILGIDKGNLKLNAEGDYEITVNAIIPSDIFTALTYKDIAKLLNITTAREAMTALPMFGTPYTFKMTVKVSKLTISECKQTIYNSSGKPQEDKIIGDVSHNLANYSELFKTFAAGSGYNKVVFDVAFSDGSQSEFTVTKSDIHVYKWENSAAGAEVTSDDTVFKNDKFLKHGTYVIGLNFSGVMWYSDVINVDEAKLVCNDSNYTDPKEFKFGDIVCADYSIALTKADGTTDTLPVTAVVFGSVKYPEDSLSTSDGGKHYKILNNLANCGISFARKISFDGTKYNVAASSAYFITDTIKLEANTFIKGLAVAKKNSYLGQTVLGMYTVTLDSVTYSLAYDAAAKTYQLVDAKGAKYAGGRNVSVKLYYTVTKPDADGDFTVYNAFNGKTVELDKEGRVINLPGSLTGSSIYIGLKLTVNDYFYQGDVSYMYIPNVGAVVGVEGKGDLELTFKPNTWFNGGGSNLVVKYIDGKYVFCKKDNTPAFGEGLGVITNLKVTDKDGNEVALNNGKLPTKVGTYSVTATVTLYEGCTITFYKNATIVVSAAKQ